jgi:hypothetical protein
VRLSCDGCGKQLRCTTESGVRHIEAVCCGCGRQIYRALGPSW